MQYEKPEITQTVELEGELTKEGWGSGMNWDR